MVTPGGDEPKYGILVTFLTFALELPDYEGGPCLDYVQFVYDGGSTSRLCGTTIPGPFLFNTTSITLRFVSDGQNQRAGFTFNYTEVITDGGGGGGGGGGSGNSGNGGGGSGSNGNGGGGSNGGNTGNNSSGAQSLLCENHLQLLVQIKFIVTVLKLVVFGLVDE